MNLIGKIFVLLVFAMSLIFMAFAVVVYSTHRNWKAEVAVVKKQMDDARAAVQKAEEEKARLEKQIKDEEIAKRQVLAKLETEKVTLQAERDEAVKQRDVLVTKDKESVAALDTSSQNLARLTKEVETLRTEIREAQSDRDKHFDQVVELTDNIHQVQGQVKRLDERRLQLAGEVAAQKLVLSAHGLTKDTPVDKLPPMVRGKVLAINRDDMVEISLGQDDGLRQGHTVEIFRGSKYLGRVEVLQASPDRSVGKVLPAFKKGVIQKDDDVATRLKVG